MGMVIVVKCFEALPHVDRFVMPMVPHEGRVAKHFGKFAK